MLELSIPALWRQMAECLGRLSGWKARQVSAVWQKPL